MNGVRLERASVGVDLTNCDREPIHVPGAIQPHGVLLVLGEDDALRVTQASENVDVHLGVGLERVLGHALTEVLGRPAADLIASALAAPDLDPMNPLALEARGRRLAGVLHRHDGATILELEPASGETRGGAPLRRALHALQRATTLAELSKLLVAEIRRLTGFERVLLYRFDEQGHGSVDAEARDAQVESYLGLRYPASDIPQQARRLYMTNWLRSIPDARYTPARIVPTLRPDTGAPLDLSRSTLRSVSPIHLEYLANMGTRASFSVSLVVRDRLWGLISCGNHSAPRHVGHEARSACEALGRLASLQLAALQDQEASLRRAERRAPLERLAAAIRAGSQEEDVLLRLLSRGPELLSLVGAEGVAVTSAGETSAFGRVPDARTLAEVVRWLGARGEGAPFATSMLPAELEAALEAKDVASGLLTFALPGEPPRRLTWFRPELARTTTWGGDPRKPIEVDPSTRLHPRRSFAAWREEVRLRSRPWTDSDLDAAEDLRRIVVELDLERQVALARRAVRARDDLVAVVSHDLRTPLNLIQLQATLLTGGPGEREPSPRLRASAEGILRSVSHMSALIHDLLDLARIEAGRFVIRPRPEDLASVVEEAMTSFRPLAAARRIALHWSPLEPTSVDIDRDRIFQVLSNLLANALKFTPEGGSVRVSAERRGSEAVLAVADTGPGIAPAALGHLFERYWQAPGRQEREGTGLGLFIARGIVEAHGGRIWVESAPGEGSTFRFALPITTS